MTYAATTEVSVEKSRAEIEAILGRYGARRFGYMTDENSAQIGFVVHDMGVKFILPLPKRDEKRFWSTPGGRRRRNEQEAYLAWEQGCRSAWRALCLCIKAKLEAVQCGITTFEQEFLAHFILPNGETFGDHAIPQLATIRNGQMPRLLLENSKPERPVHDHI